MVVEGVAVQLVLGDEVLGAVLADQADAGVAQRAQVLGGHVLGGDEHAHAGRVAAGGPGRLGDPALDLREAFADRVHIGDELSDHVFLLGGCRVVRLRCPTR